MSTPHRLRGCLLVAAAAHLCVAMALSHHPKWLDEIPGSTAARTTALPETDIDLESPVEATEEAFPPALPSENRSPSPRARWTALARPEIPHGGAIDGTPAPSGATTSETVWNFSPTTAAPPPNISPSAHAAAIRTAVTLNAKDEPARRPRAFGSREIELGLVPGGELVTLTRDSVRRSLAPIVSSAHLSFDVDRSGVVVSAHAFDVSSGAAEWREVAEAIVNAARSSTHVRIPDGANGISLVIEAASSLRTVSGGPPADGLVPKIVGPMTDPLGAVTDRLPPTRVVTARIVSISAL